MDDVYTHEVNSVGTQKWFKDGIIHRDDGPAIIYANGDQCWYKNGYVHREDGPAVIDANDIQIWFCKDYRITDNVLQWAKDCQVDLDNMTNEDKDVLKFYMELWSNE